MMLYKTKEEFMREPGTLIHNAIVNDDFVTVKTSEGNAVIISEDEWNILKDGFKQLLALTTGK